MPEQQAEAGLVTHRFNSADVTGGLSRQTAAVVRHSRLYDLQDNALDRLAWYETEGYVAPDETTSWTQGVARVERMSFHLHRAAQSATGRLEDCRWLYVVHTDIPDDVSREYNTWYDQEHLPRLVQVPGIIRARRYASPDESPRYLTAYELSDRDAFSSPEGLKARNTPWTARMRALFSNTRRFTGLLLEAT